MRPAGVSAAGRAPQEILSAPGMFWLSILREEPVCLLGFSPYSIYAVILNHPVLDDYTEPISNTRINVKLCLYLSEKQERLLGDLK